MALSIGQSRSAALRMLCVLLVVCMYARAEERPLVFGVHPYLPASELAQRFTPLVTHLERAIGRPVRIRIGHSYDDHLAALEQGRVDLAFIGPVSYIELVKRHGAWPIAARLSFSGKTSFRGAIVVRDDSVIGGLSDLAGKRFAFGDRRSTLSSVVPMALLRRAGVGLGDLAEYRHLSNHHNVALGVLMGYYDAGGIKGEVFEEFDGQGLKAMTFTPWISSHLFLFSRQVPVPLQDLIRQVLYELADEPGGRVILGKVKSGTTALVPAQDADYDSLRLLLNDSLTSAAE